MLNSPFNHEEDIIERLKHPEKERARRQMSKNLFIRNLLNSLFILLAIIAMIGIVVTDGNLMIWYGLGLFAVIIKMVEVMLRMPGIKK